MVSAILAVHDVHVIFNSVEYTLNLTMPLLIQPNCGDVAKEAIAQFTQTGYQEISRQFGHPKTRNFLITHKGVIITHASISEIKIK